ncbi:MAG: M1 family aminopeptidase [Pyrinomonadaceae bacterium]
MIFTNINSRRIFAVVFIAVFLLSGVINARPMPLRPFVQQDVVKKLPPVNWVRSRKVDIKHLDINIRFDWENSRAFGVTTVTFAPFADSDKLTLDAAMMTINSVKTAGGSTLTYTYNDKDDTDNLEITLDRVYKSGEDAKVTIDYGTNYVNKADGDTAIGSFGRGLRFIKPTELDPNKPRQIWSQGESEFNRYWFPSYDTPNDFRTTELKATVAKPLFVVSNGKLVATTENADNTRTFDWVMDQPHANYLTSIVVSETTPVIQDFEGIPVYNYGYTNETKEVALTTKNLPATMKFFSEITGVKYPYAKYSQAFVEDFGGGMENITATTQIEEMIHDDREMLDADSEGLQSHELAHQWFGDFLTCRDWGQIWLNESFATYMQAMWTERLKGHDEFLYSDIRGNQNTVINTWKQGNRRPIVTKYFANKDAMFDNYAYPGGASVLHMLRKHLGDKLFSKALNHYLIANANQPVSTEDFRIAVEETTGQSMDWFFDQWLYRMGHPIFEITQNYDDAGKKLTMNIKQTQTIDVNNEYPQVAYFQTYVDIAIDGRIERAWIKPQAENVYTFDVAAKPKLVSFDYESSLLKEMKFEKSTDDLLYQMQNDKDVIGRRWAMGELQGKAADAVERGRIVTALIASAEKDPSFRVRRAAVTVIATIFSPDPPAGQERPAANLPDDVVQAMMRLAKDKNSLVRGETIQLLGETKQPKFADLYLAAINDPSYSVIEQASQDLAVTKDPRAYDALVKLTTTPSWRDRIRIAGIQALATLGDKRALESGLKMASDLTVPLKTRTAAITLVAATGKGDARAFPIVFDRFKQAFAAHSDGTMINSVRAIVRIADPRGQEAFDMLKERYKADPGALRNVTNFEQQFNAAIQH